MKAQLSFILLIIFSLNVNANTLNDSLYNELSRSVDDSTKARIYMELAEPVTAFNYDSSSIFLSKALNLVDTTNYVLLSRLYNNIALSLFFKNDFDSAAIYYLKNVRLNKTLNDSAEVKKAYLNAAISNIHGGNTKKSLQYSLLAKTFVNKKDSSELAKCNNIISDAYLQLCDYPKAFEYIYQAIDFYKDSKDSSQILRVYFSLGNTYAQTLMVNKAINAYKRALNYVQNDGYIRSKDIINNIAYVYMQSGVYLDSAVILYRKLQKTTEDTNSYSMLLAYANLAGTYYKLGNIDSAEYFNRKALSHPKIRRRKMAMTGVCINMGQLYIYKNSDSAYYYLEKGLELSKIVKKQTFIRNAYSNLIKVDSIVGDYKKLAEHRKSYYETVLELENTDTKKKIANLTSTFELRNEELKNDVLFKESIYNKQKIHRTNLFNYFLMSAIAIFLILLFIIRRNYRNIKALNNELIKRNEIVKEQNKLLEQENIDKNMFFRIIAHDLKNPVGGVNAYLEQLLEMKNDLSKDDFVAALQTISKTAKSTHSLLLDLLQWGKLQSSEFVINNDEVCVDSIFDKLYNEMYSQFSAKEISLKVNHTSGISINTDPNILETILRNFMSNAIKHTTRKGNIEVYFEDKSEWLLIFVKDNGVGIPEDKIGNIFNLDSANGTKGTEGEESNGLGLKIVKSFANKIGAKLGVESKEGFGTTFWIEIKKN